jgi:hypothetical protein
MQATTQTQDIPAFGAPRVAAPPRTRHRRRAVALIAGGTAAIALLAGSQAILPGMAESHLRDDLAKQGTVGAVHVSAFPAVKLLWGKADDVTVRMDSMRASTDGTGGSLSDALARTSDVRDLDLSVATLTAGPLRLRDVRLTKHGDALHADAAVSNADVRKALPSGFDLRPTATADGELVLKGTVEALGSQVQGSARLLARDGKLEMAPQGGPLSLAPPVTVFSDSALQVRDVGATKHDGRIVISADAVQR